MLEYKKILLKILKDNYNFNLCEIEETNLKGMVGEILKVIHNKKEYILKINILKENEIKYIENKFKILEEILKNSNNKIPLTIPIKNKYEKYLTKFKFDNEIKYLHISEFLEDNFNRDDLEENLDIFIKCGKFIANFHKEISKKKYKTIERKTFNNIIIDLNNRIKNSNSLYLNLKDNKEIISQSLFLANNIILHIEKYTNIYNNKHNGIIHGDFHINQILIKNNEIIGVIDFEEENYSNPIYDIVSFIYVVYLIKYKSDLKNRMIYIFLLSYRKVYGSLPITNLKELNFFFNIRIIFSLLKNIENFFNNNENNNDPLIKILKINEDYKNQIKYINKILNEIKNKNIKEINFELEKI